MITISIIWVFCWLLIEVLTFTEFTRFGIYWEDKDIRQIMFLTPFLVLILLCIIWVGRR